MINFRVAVGVGPKPEALGAFGTQAFTLFTAEPHTKSQFYMQIWENPIEEHSARIESGTSQNRKRRDRIFGTIRRVCAGGARYAV